MVQGSLIDSEYKGISTMEIMNYLAPDVVALGNHEFDYGLPHLLFLEKIANFPIVNANLYISPYNKRMMMPYLILKKAGFDILFTGIITEKVIDSTLTLQNDWGLWDEDVSYCIDLDAIFALLRCQKLIPSYRKQEIKSAILKYLDYTIPSLNDRDFLFNRYDTSHKLTGCLGAIAEIYKFHPELFRFPKPFIQTLDIVPWI